MRLSDSRMIGGASPLSIRRLPVMCEKPQRLHHSANVITASSCSVFALGFVFISGSHQLLPDAPRMNIGGHAVMTVRSDTPPKSENVPNVLSGKR